MKTLYEEIMRQDYSSATKEQKTIISEMDKAEIINIQNVADYVFGGSQKGWEIIKDFPNIAPPFPVFWMEYIDTRGGDNSKAGFLFNAVRIDETLKWSVSVSWVHLINGDLLFIPITFLIGVNEDGSVAKSPSGQPAVIVNINKLLNPQKEDFEKLNLQDMFVPPLLAVSFMHCKNVTITSNSPEKKKGKRLSRNVSRVKYHTLQIEPMKKILRDEGDSENSGIKHALHICRGHFKDFSKGNGLFGKFRDMYWWDSQVRGNSKHGIVSKDYSINTNETQ